MRTHHSPCVCVMPILDAFLCILCILLHTYEYFDCCYTRAYNTPCIPLHSKALSTYMMLLCIHTALCRHNVVCSCMLVYACVCSTRVCSCMLVYARVCLCMLVYARVCSCMLVYARVCSCMLLYARVCSRMLVWYARNALVWLPPLRALV